MRRRDDRAAWTAWAESKGLIEAKQPARKNKYGAVKTGKYDSKKEAARAGELKLWEKAGAITELREQVRFELIPPQEGERPTYYISDFAYILDGKLVVEDVKSKATKTQAYRIKKKMMLQVHGIRIQEV